MGLGDCPQCWDAHCEHNCKAEIDKAVDRAVSRIVQTLQNPNNSFWSPRVSAKAIELMHEEGKL